jgi:hypothetical protein
MEGFTKREDRRRVGEVEWRGGNGGRGFIHEDDDEI